MQELTLTLDAGRVFLAAGLSDLGCVRENNEDTLGLFPEGAPGHGYLLVVADGMGGVAGGEVASRIAVDTFHAVMTGPGLPADPAEALTAAFREANRAIFAESQRTTRLSGMGTTLTAAWIRDREILIAHIGDSRAYRVSRGGVELLTEDHTLATEMARRESEFEVVIPAMAHHVLTRCLGVGHEIEVDIHRLPDGLAPDQVLILCSDGLSGPVEDAHLRAPVLDRAPADACRRLVELAREGGGPDNISVIVARAAEFAAGSDETASLP